MRYLDHCKIIIYIGILTAPVLSYAQQKIKGITQVAPPLAFEQNPNDEILNVKAEWISLVPYGYQKKENTAIKFNQDWQWWGEQEKGIRTCATLAKEKGLKIMLKPQIYVPGSWVGDISFDNESNWVLWEKAYRTFIMFYVDLAVELDLEMLCIGTECKKTVVPREEFWKKLIRDIRIVYPGRLTYSSNWDSYNQIPFWSELDYIGISAYFPLTDTKTPDVSQLIHKWAPIVNKLRDFSSSLSKPILFTEFGYLSVDGCAGKVWELEQNINHLNVNEVAQSNALEALFRSFWEREFWAGGFIWKWFPEDMGHEGYIEKDYTPQNKLSEKVLRKWYSRCN